MNKREHNKMAADLRNELSLLRKQFPQETAKLQHFNARYDIAQQFNMLRKDLHTVYAITITYDYGNGNISRVTAYIELIDIIVPANNSLQIVAKYKYADGSCCGITTRLFYDYLALTQVGDYVIQKEHCAVKVCTRYSNAEEFSKALQATTANMVYSIVSQRNDELDNISKLLNAELECVKFEGYHKLKTPTVNQCNLKYK